MFCLLSWRITNVSLDEIELQNVGEVETKGRAVAEKYSISISKYSTLNVKIREQRYQPFLRQLL